MTDGWMNSDSKTADRNLMVFKQRKGKVLPLRKNDPKQ